MTKSLKMSCSAQEIQEGFISLFILLMFCRFHFWMFLRNFFRKLLLHYWTLEKVLQDWQLLLSPLPLLRSYLLFLQTSSFFLSTSLVSLIFLYLLFKLRRHIVCLSVFLAYSLLLHKNAIVFSVGVCLTFLYPIFVSILFLPLVSMNCTWLTYSYCQGYFEWNRRKNRWN